MNSVPSKHNPKKIKHNACNIRKFQKQVQKNSPGLGCDWYDCFFIHSKGLFTGVGREAICGEDDPFGAPGLDISLPETVIGGDGMLCRASGQCSPALLLLLLLAPGVVCPRCRPPELAPWGSSVVWGGVEKFSCPLQSGLDWWNTWGCG